MAEPKIINGEKRCPVCGSKVVWISFYENWRCTFDHCGWGWE